MLIASIGANAMAIRAVTELVKPKAQGGRWLLAKQMKIL